MTSPVIPAPTVPIPLPTYPTGRGTAAPATPAPGLPVARTADAAEYDVPLSVDLDADTDTVVLRADGEVDMLTVDRLREALDQGLAARPTVVADLRGVSFVDCTGVGLLADARHRAQHRGIRLRIIPGRAVARTAALLGLTVALGLHEQE